MINLVINCLFNPFLDFLNILITNSQLMKIANLVIIISLYLVIHLKSKYTKSDDVYCFELCFDIMTLFCYINALTLLLPISEFRLENMNYVILFLGFLSLVEKIKKIKDDTIEYKNKYKIPKRTVLGFFKLRKK